MKELQNKIWNKLIQETLEKELEAFEHLNRLRIVEETEKRNKQIENAKREIKKLSTNELAELLVAFENSVKEQADRIRDLEKSSEAPEKIRDIIISEYGLDEY